jgi:hypothetical protein
LLPSAPLLSPVINCVVIGRAHTAAGPKVGGIFASGRAYYQRSTGPVYTTPGGDPRSLLLKIFQVPYVEQLVLLTTVIPAADAPYTAYVEGGDHLTSPAAAAPAHPPHPGVTHTYYCDPKDGKITTVPPGRKPAGSHKVAHKTSACVVGQKPPVVPPAPVVSAGPFPLIDVPNHLETRWLTKVQAAAYAEERKAATTDPARKTVDDKYRLLVKAQLRPEAAAAYATAYASPVAEAPAKIAAAIGAVEMWGGPVTAVVGLFQETASPATAKMLEIQLSKADWDVLNSSAPAKPEYKAAAAAYKTARRSRRPGRRSRFQGVGLRSHRPAPLPHGGAHGARQDARRAHDGAAEAGGRHPDAGGDRRPDARRARAVPELPQGRDDQRQAQ